MRFIKSLSYAWQGIKYCFRVERNFRIQVMIVLIACVFAIVLKIGTNEWIAILFCWALVLGLEMINTAIEKLSNVVSTSIHPDIKVIKDVAAGAVFLVSIISLAIACIIFLPKIYPFIKNIFE
ncbi:diacylglycerol kinase family protein [Ginsengibacter hankyongi]|uniref:Diacylglycerol kinase family protein n=1 Tax=Ginsengibacter hankyongi TaxID=2607284 RepID=A0A5J5IKT8_9BACT|nr:diacylglycerol kinase family protein [Ginsengibacter hankyongi]KAA9041735.1 diacylglycerol kinase family protein [Ginsengibacter hankyongi]